MRIRWNMFNPIYMIVWRAILQKMGSRLFKCYLIRLDIIVNKQDTEKHNYLMIAKDLISHIFMRSL